VKLPILSVAVTAAVVSSAFAEERPNIIYFVCHDLGRMVSPYGAKVDTPNLQSFADSGVTLMNAYCSSPCCSPSRGCAMTGRYAHKTGLMGVGNGWELKPDEKTIVNYLNDAGYLTVHAGFQHERHRPEYRMGDPTYNDPNGYQVDARRVGGWPGVFVENVVDDAIHWLKTRDPNDPQPFYFNIGSQEAHESIFDGPRGRKYKRNEVYGIDDPATVWVPPSLPDNEKSRDCCSKLLPCIRHLDREFGRLVEAIDELGYADNTIVVFTTDHGIFASRHKMTVFDDGTEIATFIRWPGHIAPGKKNELIGNVDFCPTFLDAAGAPVPEIVDGRSFWPLLTGGNYIPNESIVIEFNYHAKYDPMRAVHTPDYLYIRNFHPLAKYRYTPAEILALPTPQCDGWPNNSVLGSTAFDHPSMKNWPARPREQLYDLRKDPQEFVNLSGNPEYAGPLKALSSELDQWMVKNDDLLLHGDIPDARKTAVQ
jgi:N-sulfoglucosamine sulfohydrolase